MYVLKVEIMQEMYFFDSCPYPPLTDYGGRLTDYGRHNIYLKNKKNLAKY